MNSPWGEPDLRRSPHTGWTRTHWERVVDGTLASVRRFASPNHALIDLPGPVSKSGRHSDGLEGFARSFLAAGFRLAHGSGGGLAEWYARGLAAGADPASPDRWPRLTELDQARVEAASIVIALHESREVIWDHLGDRARDQIVTWLSEATGQWYPACNWLWFAAVVQAFLRSVGAPWSPDEIERAIAETERWYQGDGWYTDGYEGGTARNFDWYAGWAMHFYPLWYCRIAGAHATGELMERYRARLRRYLTDAQHLYAPDGGPLHQGRSLTYRYAALAPVWAGAIFDATPLPPGRTRRLASGVLRHFAERGAAGGLQPIGWYQQFTMIRQPYSGPGSPYWSSKGFAGLVLPPEHPVWTEQELPLLVERQDVEATLRVPGWLVSGTRADGVVRVVNHGTDHAASELPSRDDPGYARYAYSTHAGPEYDGSMIDSQVALLDSHGNASHRLPLTPLGTYERVAISAHQAHWPIDPRLGGAGPDSAEPDLVWPPRQPACRPGPRLITASVLRGAVEVRLARLLEPAGMPLRIGGYALADANPPGCQVWDATALVERTDGLKSMVIGLLGLPLSGIASRQGANPFGQHSAVPWVASAGPAQAGQVYAAAVVLSGAGLPALPTVAVTADCDVVVGWPDGPTDRVQLQI